jgi:hypothetical protein
MKKLLICLCFLTGTLWAYPNHSPELAAPLRTLYQLEETQRLLNQVEKEGSIKIKAVKLGSQAQNACWFPDERTICVNISKRRSFASLICSLVFELHNALNQKKFDQFDLLAMQGKITKAKYIESVEHQEYLNALQTMQILKKGVERQIFPPDISSWAVAPTFQEHYRVQRESGHSQSIGMIFDSLHRHTIS